MDDAKSPTPLGDLFELQRGNTYKSALLGLPGPVLLGLASIARNSGFKSDILKTYGGASDSRVLLGPEEICVSLKDVTQSADLLGAVSRVPKWIRQGRLTQDAVELTFKKANTSRDYIYWCLQTPQYRAYCRAERRILAFLARISSVPIPPLTAIRAQLTEVLQALDDKIDLNWRTNETLERTARAIFRDWFERDR